MSVESQQRQGSELRKPFFSVFLNDTDVLTGVYEVEVTNNSHFAADTFRLSIAINDLPPSLGIDYWSNSVGDELEIFAGFKDATGQGQSASLIYAQVDDVEIDIISRTMLLQGRDLSARFLDTKTAEYYQDNTASQIATILAKGHGMKANVTPTEVRVGGYYEYYHTSMAKDQSEWDILTFLAEQETYDLWVTKKTLNFQPPVPDNADPYVIRWSDDGQGNRKANFETIKLQRSQTLAKDVKVIVKSWNQDQETVIVAENHRIGSKKNQRAGGTAQEYTFYPPNLTKEQADKFANAKAEEITKHERVISGTLPGDNLLTNRSLIKLVGTGTSWDQSYNVQSVTRRISIEHGYTMEYRAKNHSVQNTIII